MENNKKIFLFIGSCDREGCVSRLKAFNIDYKRKMLESKVSNWVTIVEIASDKSTAGIITKLTGDAYRVFGHPEYINIRQVLVETIKSKPHIVFAHESLLSGVSEQDLDRENDEYEDEYYRHQFFPPPDGIRNSVNSLFHKNGITIIPYKTNAEMTLLASQFIDQNANHLLFRMYIPNGKMWAEEADKLLKLFKDYLIQVSGLNIRQEQVNTGHGIAYEFYGDEGTPQNSLAAEFDDFSKFMNSCVNNVETAESLLVDKNIDPQKITAIITKYSKEAKRLNVDLKQERERKLLSIRHRLESELSDVINEDFNWVAIDSMVNAAVPLPVSVVSPIQAISFSSKGGHSPVATPVEQRVVNISNCIIASEINGNQNIGLDGQNLLDLIRRFGGIQAAELSSAVHELSDTNSKPDVRLASRQKLKSFLYAVADKAGDVGIGLLQRYLENQLGF